MVSTWDESMETGHPMIDQQHRELIGLVDELDDAEFRSEDHGAVLHVLDRVTEFALTHFDAEEDLMEQVDYPPVPTREMVERHREFKAYTRLRVLEFRAGEMLGVGPLQSFLRDWLTEHEFGLDRQLVDWMRQRNRTAVGAGRYRSGG
ncbi:MAG: hypothetical protein IBX62_08145 [Coriobacteriia bacterium]|nr:hypothetical protein [Coriobacteriia bacterium]